MTHNITKVRAALECAKSAAKFCVLPGLDREADEGLAALAELEKAAAPQFVAGEVTRPMCHGAWARFWSEPNTGDSCDQARRWLEAWRSELGPALGMVEIREPSDDECADIHQEWLNAHGIQGYGAVQNGRAMFNSVRAVMWPKEGL